MRTSTRLLLFNQIAYANRVMSVAPGTLIGYWPLWEASGSVAQGYGKDLEYLTNGGFEDAGAGGADIWGTWVETAGDGALANETTIVQAGSDAAKITAGATANTKVVQTIAVQPGTPLTLTFWTRGDGTNGGRYLVYDATAGANIIAATATGVTGTTYTLVTATFTAPAACVSIRVDLMCPAANGGICYFDAVSVMGKAYGAYTGGTLGNAGIGDGRTSLFEDGSGDFVNIYSSGLINAFNGSEGTLIAWGKVAAASVWEDATFRRLVMLSADGDNFISLLRTSTNNQLNFYYEAGNVIDNVLSSALGGRTTWMPLGLTWSKSAELVSAYADGAVLSTSATLGVWAGTLAATQAVIGASTTTPTLVWNGSLAHVQLRTTPLPLAQIAYLSKAA